MKHLVDTGAFIAFFDSSDNYHQWAINIFDTFSRNRVFTCEVVIAEVVYMLRKRINLYAADNFLNAIENGSIQIAFKLSDEVSRLRLLMERYKDVPMDLADACIVRMSELEEYYEIVTVDRDFYIYRRNGRQPLNLVTPFEY
ncbi:MAG: PilT protein [Ignavibacteria bacterium]|nr:PilT protein [Ignavibacteria bacterium]